MTGAVASKTGRSSSGSKVLVRPSSAARRRPRRVADARWLLDGAGGGVPAEHMVLALAPRDDEPPDLPFVEATKDKIMIAINDLLSMSGGKGERLYFFYAGTV